MRIRFALYTYLIIKTRVGKSDRLWTNMVDVLACFVFVAFSHIGWRLYFIHAKKGMFDKCRGYFEVSSFRENRWTPWYKKIKKGLRRQIVHKYACWRLRLFLCEITDAVFWIIEMKEMGLTFVQPLASSTNILSPWNVFRMFKRCFLFGIKWQRVDISDASDI